MSSPFDTLRHIQGDREFWSGRELMGFLDYSHWHHFTSAIDRAIISCRNHGRDPAEHFLRTTIATQGRSREDYHLSRYAVYLVAMTSDTRKDSVAHAQGYFFRLICMAESGFAAPAPQPLPTAAMATREPVQRHRTVRNYSESVSHATGRFAPSRPPYNPPQTDAEFINEFKVSMMGAMYWLSQLAKSSSDRPLATRADELCDWLIKTETFVDRYLKA